MFEVKSNEMLFIYNSQHENDRKALGYAATLKDHKLNSRDICKDPLTETQLMKLAKKMDKKVEDLFDKNAEAYMNNFKDKDFSAEEAVTVLRKNPEILKTPIIVLYDEVYHLPSPYALVKGDLNIGGVSTESAHDLEKTNKK